MPPKVTRDKTSLTVHPDWQKSPPNKSVRRSQAREADSVRARLFNPTDWPRGLQRLRYTDRTMTSSIFMGDSALTAWGLAARSSRGSPTFTV